MLDKRIIDELKQIVGADNVATDRQDLICYGYDATQMEFLPDAVVHPGSPDEVSAVLKVANREKFPIYP
ncbi:FAD-binding oxidoreductase, partial [bacterium]|nr:FAD-binding oxidoreductase [bacterium]